MKKFLIFATLFCSTVYASDVGVSPLPSMNWQRQTLEKNIRTKVEGVLGVVTHSGLFSVDVLIDTNTVEVPKFNEPLNEDGEVGSLGKNSKSKKKKKSNIANEDVAEVKKKSRASIKFSDVLPSDDIDDVIVFSKFGMEAPLIDDFNDFNPDGKIVLSMQNASDKDRIEEIEAKFKKEEKKLIKEIESLNSKLNDAKVSPVEQIWKYNKSVDIFENLKSVSIMIRLSDSMSQDMKLKIENLVNKLNFNLGKIKPVIKFEYSIFTPKDKRALPSQYQTAVDILNHVSKFSNVIAILLGMLLMAVVGKNLIVKYFDLNQGVSNSGNFKMEAGDIPEKDDEVSDSSGAGAGATSVDGLGTLSLNGIERFTFYVENTPKEAILLLKKWLSLGTKKSNSALRAIVQQVDNSSLKEVFSKISQQERETWKSLLDKPLNNAELAIANDFISNQIVQNVIVPSLIDDPETYDYMLKIRPESISSIHEKEPETSSLIVNSLNDNFIAEVLSNCEPEVRDDIIKRAINVTETDVRNGQQKIKEALRTYMDDTQRKPFVNKLISILPTSLPQVEQSIYSSLTNHMGYSELREIASQTFPAELVERLPVPFMKSALSSYPLEKKVKMLLSLDENLKNQFVSIFAPEGTKASDLMKIEFDSIESDEDAMKQIRNDSSQLWYDFVVFTRKLISLDKQFNYEIDEILNEWCENKISEASTTPDLRAVG